MSKERIFTKGMTNQQVVYVSAKRYVDKIARKAVSEADELMSNPFVAEVLIQAAEAAIAYERWRERAIIGGDKDDCLYFYGIKDNNPYQDVLFNCLFRLYDTDKTEQEEGEN